MFRVVFDLGGITCEGFIYHPFFFSQLPNEVTNLNVVGLFYILGWTASVVLWPNDSGVRESGLA